MGVRRGDITLIVVSGDYGKPRPAVVVQTDLANETHASIVVCPLTTHLQDAPLFRLPVEPSSDNGLNKKSQIMVDKIVAVRKDKVRDKIGCLDKSTMLELNRALFLWLGLA